jgi:hypothetical protein
MQAAGAAIAGAGVLSGQVAAVPPGQQKDGGSLFDDRNGFVVGGRHVVGESGYGTIQEAWDAATDGDEVVVHSSYDAETAGERFPITLDYTQKQVTLTGGHPSGSVIDARHAPSTNVLEVVGNGHADYRNNALVRNLKVVGGDVGMRVRAAPYASFENLVFWMTGSHGVVVDRSTASGTFGVTFQNCVAWNCGGDGFRLHTGADPHSTTFYGCHSLLNADAGVRLRGYATRWHGGTIQNNGGVGVDARSGCSQLVDATYFEGNDTASDAPMEVYVDDSAPGFTLHGSYFQGGYFRDFTNGRDTGRWGVVVGGASHADVRNCSFRNYTDCFLYVRDATDADVHLGSHCPLDETTPFEHRGCTRLRSDGTLLPTDLSGGAQPGRFVGDTGTHDGSGTGSWGPATWNGTAWVSAVDGTEL